MTLSAAKLCAIVNLLSDPGSAANLPASWRGKPKSGGSWLRT
jgi:hypothetical protein